MGMLKSSYIYDVRNTQKSHQDHSNIREKLIIVLAMLVLLYKTELLVWLWYYTSNILTNPVRFFIRSLFNIHIN